MPKRTKMEIPQMGVQKISRLPENEAKKYLSQGFSASNAMPKRAANAMPKRTTEEILQMGVQKLRRLPESEARKYLSQVFSAANKRVKSLSKLERTPYALKQVQTSGIKKFGVKGKKTKELWKQYAAVQSLWAQKSGTVKGAKEVEQNVFRIQALMASLSEEQQQVMWDIYNRLMNSEIPGSHLYVKQTFGSDNMQNFITEELKSGVNADELMARLQQMIEGNETPEQARVKNVDDTIDFFHLGQN